MITENANAKWSQIIKEEFGIENKSKLNWISQYAQNHEIYEAVQSGSIDGGIYTTPLNTLGMGNPMMPTGVGFNGADGKASGVGIGNTGADFHNVNYKVGSGDIPMSTLQMSLEVAAMTIGLELVPVIPSNGPWAMLSYMDFPYAGGKLGRINETSLDGKGDGNENKPIYIKVKGTTITNTKGETVALGNETLQVVGKYLGKSRIDNSPIIEVWGVMAKGDVETTATKDSLTLLADKSIADAFEGSTMTPDLVSAAADHIQGFANFFDGQEGPMTRAQNETGVGNTIGARMFTKLIQMGAYEVTGTVTRQQLQDMPLYGVDVIGKVLEAMQNELSQHINHQILDRVFKLGVTNAKTQKEYQNVDLNLYFGTGSKALANFTAASKFVGINDINAATGVDTNPKSATYGTVVGTTWGNVPSATQNTSAENFTTHQRRIMSRVLAGANLITQVSRFGRPNWVVTNSQIATALQDCAGYVVAPMTNTMVQDGSNSLYFAGSIAGLSVYVDPYMTWDDTRICIGRKSDGATPGVVFMPYILCDTVQITAEGTMAPKLLCNSRFAVVDCGFHPEQNYLTFMVDTDGAYLI